MSKLSVFDIKIRGQYIFNCGSSDISHMQLIADLKVIYVHVLLKIVGNSVSISKLVLLLMTYFGRDSLFEKTLSDASN